MSNKITSKTRIVLFGLGKMGRNHLRVLSQHPKFQVVAVVDNSLSIQDSLVVGVPLLRSIEDLANDAYDAAVIATPTRTHFALAKDILQRKKALLVEKPLASDAASCLRLSEIASAQGVPLVVGHVERFNPAVRKLNQVINEGWLGKPIHISMTRVGGYPQTQLEGNNVLLDLAVHDLDLVRRLLGPVRLVSSICHSSLRSDIVDTAEILVMSKKGVSVTLHVNWITPTKIRTARVTGTRAVCLVDYILQSCQIFGGNLLNQQEVVEDFDFNRIRELYENTDRIELGVQKEEPLRVEYDHFARLLAGESHELCLGDEATQVVALAQDALAHGEMQNNVESEKWY